MKEQHIIVNYDMEHFLSNQQGIVHGPDKLTIDFQSTFPQFSPDNKPIILINHRVIIMDIYHAKNFLNILRENIGKYEKKFGEIKKSEQIIRAEKEMKKKIEQKDTTTEAPSYMG